MDLGGEQTLNDWFSRKVRESKGEKLQPPGSKNPISPHHPAMHQLERKLMENHSHTLQTLNLNKRKREEMALTCCKEVQIGVGS